MNTKDINKFLRRICTILDIDKPTISFLDVGFLTDTQMAVLNTKNNTIVVSTKVKNEYDVYFSIAHELRHAWQHKNHVYDFKDHVDNLTLTSHDYNSQHEEVDANAFALLTMLNLFNVSPNFNGMDKDVIALIHKRAEEINKGYV